MGLWAWRPWSASLGDCPLPGRPLSGSAKSTGRARADPSCRGGQGPREALGLSISTSGALGRTASVASVEVEDLSGQAPGPQLPPVVIRGKSTGALHPEGSLQGRPSTEPGAPGEAEWPPLHLREVVRQLVVVKCPPRAEWPTTGSRAARCGCWHAEFAVTFSALNEHL